MKYIGARASAAGGIELSQSATGDRANAFALRFTKTNGRWVRAGSHLSKTIMNPVPYP